MMGSRRMVSLVAFLGTAGLMWNAVEAARIRLPKEAEALAPPRTKTRAPLPDPKELARNPFLPPGEEDPDPAGTAGGTGWRLSGVVVSGTLRVALLDGQTVREGDTFHGFQVASIQPGRVVLSREGRSVEVAPGADALRPAGGDSSSPQDGPRLTAVIRSGEVHAAVISGSTVREGGAWGGYVLESVGTDGVRLAREGKSLELKLWSAPPPAAR